MPLFAAFLLSPLLPKLASSHVLLMEDRFEVRRVDAELVSADVVELKPVGDFSDKLLVREFVCFDGFAVEPECGVPGS